MSIAETTEASAANDEGDSHRFAQVDARLSVAMVVQDIYQSLLNREAEPAAVEIWGRALADGMTLASFVTEVINSAEFTSRFSMKASTADSAQTAEIARLSSVMERAIMTLIIGDRN